MRICTEQYWKTERLLRRATMPKANPDHQSFVRQLPGSRCLASRRYVCPGHPGTFLALLDRNQVGERSKDLVCVPAACMCVSMHFLILRQRHIPDLGQKRRQQFLPQGVTAISADRSWRHVGHSPIHSLLGYSEGSGWASLTPPAEFVQTNVGQLGIHSVP